VILYTFMWIDYATVSLMAIAGFLTSSVVTFEQTITEIAPTSANQTKTVVETLWPANISNDIKVGDRHLLPNQAIFDVLPEPGSKVKHSIFPAPRRLPFVW
jgi:hypothetical protein